MTKLTKRLALLLLSLSLSLPSVLGAKEDKAQKKVIAKKREEIQKENIDDALAQKIERPVQQKRKIASTVPNSPEGQITEEESLPYWNYQEALKDNEP